MRWGIEGAKGPDGAGIWDQRSKEERDPEKGAGGRDEANRLPSHDSGVVRTNSAATRGC